MDIFNEIKSKYNLWTADYPKIRAKCLPNLRLSLLLKKNAADGFFRENSYRFEGGLNVAFLYI